MSPAPLWTDSPLCGQPPPHWPDPTPGQQRLHDWWRTRRTRKNWWTRKNWRHHRRCKGLRTAVALSTASCFFFLQGVWHWPLCLPNFYTQNSSKNGTPFPLHNCICLSAKHFALSNWRCATAVSAGSSSSPGKPSLLSHALLRLTFTSAKLTCASFETDPRVVWDWPARPVGLTRTSCGTDLRVLWDWPARPVGLTCGTDLRVLWD